MLAVLGVGLTGWTRGACEKELNLNTCFFKVVNVRVNRDFTVLPLSILTATVLHVESLSIPKAEASTTFPKAPWPRVLPGKGRKYLISGTALELPVPRVKNPSGFPVSQAMGLELKQHARALITRLFFKKMCCSLKTGWQCRSLMDLKRGRRLLHIPSRGCSLNIHLDYTLD